MKYRHSMLTIAGAILAIVALYNDASAQQYKLRQVTSTMGMDSETTIYVKGMRKRTEGGGYAGMLSNLITIEQCDLRRTITINDEKKLYHIAPFSKETQTSEEEKPAKNKPVTASAKPTTQKGGTVTMLQTITDTGERKKMYGFTARHVWTYLKMKPSPDACMKDSMIIKTDGWYIDLPQFNCPAQYTSSYSAASAAVMDCKDKYVTKQSGKGKLGFPLIEKRTMIMGNGAAETTNFEMNLKTLDFSTAKLDSMLFEIPVGYTQATNIEDLHEKPGFGTLKKAFGNSNKEEATRTISADAPKTPGVLRIGVLKPTSSEELDIDELQIYLVNRVNTGKVEAIGITSAAEAKKYQCDLMLTSKFTQVEKQSGKKIGGLLKAVKNLDPSSASSYTIEALFSLSDVSNGAVRSEKKIEGKFDGNADGAAKKVLEQGSQLLLKDLK